MDSNKLIESNFEYLLKNIINFSKKEYLINFEQRLNISKRTTGITELKFNFNESEFVLTDVGGLRNERKKWIHTFENVKGILFFVSLEELFNPLFEDNSINKLKESLTLFEEIVKSRWFERTHIFLVFNKFDSLINYLKLFKIFNFNKNN